MKQILILLLLTIVAVLTWPRTSIQLKTAVNSVVENLHPQSEKQNDTNETIKINIETRPSSPAHKQNWPEQKMEIDLKNYQLISNKVLRSQHERQQHEANLANLDMVTGSLALLKVETPESLRMLAGGYLMHALDWRKNPNHRAIVEKVSDWLSVPPKIENLSVEEQRSHIADRVELYATLYEVAPQVAEKIRSQSEAGLNQRIMTMSYNFYIQSMKPKSN